MKIINKIGGPMRRELRKTVFKRPNKIATIVRNKPQVMPLTETEHSWIEAYLACGNAELACTAIGIPVANGAILMRKPSIKRMLEVGIGFRPARDMDDAALLEEILTVSRDAAKAESYMAALTGYRLFHAIREGMPEAEAIDTSEAEATEIQTRANAFRPASS
jgi:hypothetical protein